MRLGSNILAVLLVAALRCEPSYARDPNQDMRDGYMELSEELTDCFNYEMLGRQCALNSDRPDLANETQRIAEFIMGLVIKFSKAGGVSEAGMLALRRLSMDDLANQLDHNCANLAILVEKYGLSCKPIVENPDQRLFEIIKTYRDGGHPRWPS